MTESARALMLESIERDPAYRADIAQRFAAWHSPAESGCWEWSGARSPNGYGVMTIYSRETKRGVTIAAHRVSYALSHGPIGDRHILHGCDNRACVRPDHLSAGTHTDNMQDMVRKGRHGITRALQSGVTNGAVTHTADQARAVAVLHLAGKSNRHIADATGYDLTFVSNVTSGRAWFHVTGLPRRIQIKRSQHPVKRAERGARIRGCIVGALVLNGPLEAGALAKIVGEKREVVAPICDRLARDGWLAADKSGGPGLPVVWSYTGKQP